MLLGMALAAVVLTGCKPTEKNYRAAYDAAVSKREKVNESLAADGLISEDAPRKQMIDGEEFYFAIDGVKAESYGSAAAGEGGCVGFQDADECPFRSGSVACERVSGMRRESSWR